MEPFIVSARKYRPTHFNEVVGQQAITNTLEKAIENDHLAQALLFTGPRGVGKTTCARILAKKINQDGSENPEEDFAFNIFELDAASNNSVDDIRNLIDQVRIPPQVGNYKVYIIDEVHMLSSAAFNAFLKTLEEPPNHAIFILATTEKHKIIPTILSRCQIFDFRRITVKDIKSHLASVAKSEGITAEDDALHVIAQKADGALRDALSIFDRVVSFSGMNMSRESVTENLNVLDYTYFFQVTDLLLENNIPNTLVLFNDILAKGFDGHHFVMGLASHFRDLLVCKSPETIELLEVGEQVKKMYFEQSKKTSQSFLIEAIEIANTCDLKFKTSRNQRLLVELCLMQLASISFHLDNSGEKKKPNLNGNKSSFPFVIPPSHYSNNNGVLYKNAQDEKVETKVLEPKEEFSEIKKEKPILDNNNKIIPKEIIVESVKVKETEKLQILSDRKTKKVSALSLKSIQKKHQLKEEQASKKVVHQDLPTEPFTEKEMIDAWNLYAKKVEKEGKYNLLSHLTMGVPKLKNNTIQLEFPNNTIKVEVERAKYELISFIKKSLQNFEIDLEIIVNESTEKKYAYTPMERYEKLKDKNPMIDKLRKEFGLEI